MKNISRIFVATCAAVAFALAGLGFWLAGESDPSSADPSGSTGTGVTMISSGYLHTLAIVDGRLLSWGNNGYGQLGLGHVENRSTPQRIGRENNWTYVAAGMYSSYAINNKGELYSWGYNPNGQLGLNTTTQENSPKRVMSETSNWVSVSASAYSVSYGFAVAINTEGKIYVWGIMQGYNSSSNTNTTFYTYKVPTLIAAPTAKPNVKWVMASAGSGYALMIDSDNELWGVGTNRYRQLGDGTTTDKTVITRIGARSDWASISSSGYYTTTVAGSTTTYHSVGHTLAITKSGELFSWGGHTVNSGPLGLGTTYLQATPAEVKPGTTWAMASAGFMNSYAINRAGELFVWGYAGNGALGDGQTTANQTTPKKLGEETNWSYVRGGGYYNGFAINKNGEYFAWGYNGNGQLGDTNMTSRSSPVQIWLPIIDVAAPASNVALGYTVSQTSVPSVRHGESPLPDKFTFDIVMANGAPEVTFRSASAHKATIQHTWSSNNTHTYTVSNITETIYSTDYLVGTGKFAVAAPNPGTGYTVLPLTVDYVETDDTYNFTIKLSTGYTNSSPTVELSGNGVITGYTKSGNEYTYTVRITGGIEAGDFTVSGVTKNKYLVSVPSGTSGYTFDFYPQAVTHVLHDDSYSFCLALKTGYTDAEPVVTLNPFKGTLVLSNPTERIYTIYWVQDTINENDFTVSIPSNDYVVNFNTMGAGNIAPVSVKHGQTIQKPADPRLRGFAFVGWFTTQSYDAEWNFASGVEGDMTLYAQWEYMTRADVHTALGKLITQVGGIISEMSDGNNKTSLQDKLDESTFVYDKQSASRDELLDAYEALLDARNQYGQPSGQTGTEDPNDGGMVLFIVLGILIPLALLGGFWAWFHFRKKNAGSEKGPKKPRNKKGTVLRI